MLNRRSFVAAGASALAMLGSVRVTVGQGWGATRRSVRGMDANDPDLAAYRAAVAAMKALPPSDPRNWNRFADIHRNFCPHGNWYFLPWHRAYLVALERICRQLSGKADFALPYWDWTAERELPAAFTAGDPRSNPLNHLRPGFAGGRSLADDMVGAEVMSRVLNSPDFEAFGSVRPRGQNSTDASWQRRMGAKTEFEFNPHDGVHLTIGGDMATVEMASRDPIFYLHHSNVDRIWHAWNRRGNDNSPEILWQDFAFLRNFTHPDGSPWNVAVANLQSTAALGYQYESDTIGRQHLSGGEAFAADPVSTADKAPVTQLIAYRRLMDHDSTQANRGLRRIPLPMGGAFHMASADNDRAASRDRPIGISVPLGRPLSELIHPSALAASNVSTPGARSRRQRVWATIRDIDPPSDLNTRLRVFVNCGELSATTDATNPHYATSVSFFGGGHVHHRGGHARGMGTSGACVSVDLTPALSRISRTKQFPNDRIVVQMLPVCPTGTPTGSNVRPRRVDIAII